ncbi:MAG: uracil phosphoribosyltransferase [Gammaproteobacteria bacterium]
MNNPANYHMIDHPLLLQKLRYLMDSRSNAPEFRRLVHETSILVAYEALRDWETEEIEIPTPTGPAKIRTLANHPMVISIMRAGNGMLTGVLDALPLAPVGHIGIYRDRDLDSTVEYFLRLPENIKGAPVLLLDPIIATGDTMCASVSRLRRFGVGEIRVLTILASKIGLDKLNATDDSVSVWGLRLEESLDELGHLTPGPGDVSARYYNTD